MSLTLFADSVENPANRARIVAAAHLFGAKYSSSKSNIFGRLIAIENAPAAQSIYGRKPLRVDATLAVGNERRGLSRGTLARAEEVLAIPAESRTVTTLNVAAAAAVAAWYVQRGSGAQARTTRPEARRPSLLITGDDHIEVGSSLRSAAAFGFRDVLLKDQGAGWFDGPAAIRREAMAAARRHKNALRVRRATLRSAAQFEEVVVIIPWGSAPPVKRARLAHGQRQLVVIGASPEDIDAIGVEGVHYATLDLQRVSYAPLRLVASIGLAEIARQVGRRRPMSGRPKPPTATYEAAIQLAPDVHQEVMFLEAAQLLEY